MYSNSVVGMKIYPLGSRSNVMRVHVHVRVCFDVLVMLVAWLTIALLSLTMW